MPINHISTLDKIVDYVPDILEKFCKNDEEKKPEESTANKSKVSNIEIKTEIQKEPPKRTVKAQTADFLEDE